MHEAFRSRVILSAVLAYAAAITACNVIPAQVPAFASVQQLNPEQIGTVAMSEVLALALTTIFAAALPTRLGVMAGIFGALCVALGQLSSIWVPGLLPLAVTRGLVGLGCGLAAAAVSHTIARSANPAPAFGLANGLSAVMIGAFLIFIPWVPSDHPGVRVFVPLAVLGLGLAAATFLATRTSVHENDEAESDHAPAVPSDHATGVTPLLLCLGTLVMFIPLGGIWTFSVQLGLDNGLSERLIGGLLVFAVFGGFVGGTAAAWVETRVGLVRTMLLGAASCIAACIAVGTVGGAISFAIAFCLYSAAYQFTISAFQITAAFADTQGRLPAVLLGITLVGYAMGSYVVGYLINNNLSQLIWIGGGVVCAAAALPALLAASRVSSALSSGQSDVSDACIAN
ncbi:MFS transporter [Parahaliea maris]|uniref:MFS transporter n=1 Tax=Parahaliea maris TaxID=2716870 RepID=A0A5C8ZXC2_9GAMM|nr:MFS transporter [Parahaliea maris]TXS91861.1 MFS transporter [Parahaliea maris]